jgi:phage/plasmid-associated DNA primase
MEPDIVLNATEAYRGTQDWLNRFLDECTEKATDGYILSRDLYPNTRIGPRMSGEYELKEVRFAEGMQSHGHASVRRKVGTYAGGSPKMNAVYEGLKLKDVS